MTMFAVTQVRWLLLTTCAFYGFVVVAPYLAVLSVAHAEVPNTETKPQRADADGTKSNKRSHSAGLQLVTSQVEELVPVLKHLELNSPTEYQKAIRDLDRAAKRLDSIKRRDTELYDISLREWRTRCQIDLIKAKLKVQKSQDDVDRLLSRLVQLREIEMTRISRELALLDERDRMYEERIRLSRQTMDRHESRRQQLIDQKQKLLAEPIDQQSDAFLKAIERAKKSPRPALPRESISNKDKS